MIVSLNNPVVVVRAGIGAIPIVRSGSKTIIAGSGASGMVVARSGSKTIVAQGGRGERGRTTTYSGTAGEAISALRAIRGSSGGDLYYCDGSDASDANTCVGISTTAALKGGTVTYQMSGELSDDSWSWIVGSAVYVGPNGALTQSPGSTFAQIVGFPAASDKIIIVINQAIKTI